MPTNSSALLVYFLLFFSFQITALFQSFIMEEAALKQGREFRAMCSGKQVDGYKHVDSHVAGSALSSLGEMADRFP